MRFVIAGGGVAGLAAALAVARDGHEAVVLERDAVAPDIGPQDAFAAARAGIPHFFQPHAFLPRGLRELRLLAPDVVDMLIEAGADPPGPRTRPPGAAGAGGEGRVPPSGRPPLGRGGPRPA